MNGTGKDKPGYVKIRFCNEQTRLDALQYFWIDTCCINKANEAELSRSLNSLFLWYRNAARCYVYLADVSSPLIDTKDEDERDPQSWESDFRNSRWFTRGWTLQELLAPHLVEFFSWQGKRLGDKCSLRRDIHEITNISQSALRGEPLSRFSVDERLQWIEHRQTKLEEDKAYSLLGIFSVYLLPIYGEGAASAFTRLLDEFRRMQDCIQDLRLTDPSDDKKRIEDAKGGLLADSYQWIIENSDFQQWRDNQESRVLWIKGDPGKGKTMLLCGIINELNRSIETALLSYFFCQATDSRINNATAVLRGLIYMLVDQQPYLASHVRKKYSSTKVFEDVNAWIALSEIFTDILQDSNLTDTYVIIDALDECIVEMPKLLELIVQKSSISSRVKWIVSSRNWPDIEGRLEKIGCKVKLSLELNAECVSTAVSTYIQHKVDHLAHKNDYSPEMRQTVYDHLSLHANGTFLWVALVCEDLENVRKRNVKKKITTYPSGLDSLYKKMLEKTWDSDDAECCKWVLATIALVYQPITLKELTSLIEMADMSIDELKEVVLLCGSFLSIREGTGAIYFVHQSAKDFLFREAFDEFFPSGEEEVHYRIFSKSLDIMSRTLRRDIYGLEAPGYPIEKVKQPDPDPLGVSRYSCIYWVDHLYDWNPNRCIDHCASLQDEGTVHEFIRKKYLYWLEALSICKSMSTGIASLEKLKTLMQSTKGAYFLTKLVQDAHRFIVTHKQAIQNSPLQAYVSALIFSPTHSLIKSLFKKEELDWIIIKQAKQDKWSSCLQTLEGHRGNVNLVAFSHNSIQLASASDDCRVKIWDANSGDCPRTLGGHQGWINSIAFSHESIRVTSLSTDTTIKVWDMTSGDCLQTLEGHHDLVRSAAFSHDSTRLASASDDCTVKIWDMNSGDCLQTLKGHQGQIKSVAFSHDSIRLASASSDCTVKIWDANSGNCLQTLGDHYESVRSVAFSHNSTRLASASDDATVKIWDANSGDCLQTLEGHRESVKSVAFSHDSIRLASASYDRTVKVWDVNSGDCLQTLEGHRSCVSSVVFSHDSTRLASSSYDGTVKIWDASSCYCFQTPKGHRSKVSSVAYSHDLTWLASASDDCTVKIWDANSCDCLQTLEGHHKSVNSVVFSHDSIRLASASNDRTVKVWDANNGDCLRTLEGHWGWVGSVAFSHDSIRLASASSDNTVKIWDANSGDCLRTLEGHWGWVRSVAFSHDSTRLASASSDSKVKIWDVNSGDCLQTLEGHQAWVNSMAFSHDSIRLASSSYDGTIKIWDTNNGDCLQTLEVSNSLYFISFDISDSYLYTDIGTIDISAQSDLSALPIILGPHNPKYWSLGLSSDGAWITYDSVNHVWLPSEYRPSCSAVSEGMIVAGVATGRVWTCQVRQRILD